jgi:hypothetical protein
MNLSHKKRPGLRIGGMDEASQTKKEKKQGSACGNPRVTSIGVG